MKYNITSIGARIGALILDTLVLGVLGFILGLFFEDFFISIGNSGSLIGFVISMIYFTIGYSHIANGQTIGKRVLKTQVITKEGQYLSMASAGLRSFILIAPFYLINLRIPGLDENSTFIYLISISSFIAASGIILLFFVNKSSRQSLHDLAANSFVTYTEEQDSPITININKKNGLKTFATISVIILGISLFTNSKNNSEHSNITTIYSHLKKLDGVINASISSNTTTFFGPEKQVTHHIDAALWLHKIPLDNNQIEELQVVKDAVSLIIENSDSISKYDIISIKLLRGYDIGIAKKSRTQFISQSPEKWLEAIH